jgi:Protein of unknown function (DUF3618)
MTNLTTTRNEQPTVADDPAALRADIEDARGRLGDTVDEIKSRLDLKSRAKESAHLARSRMSHAGHRATGAIGRRKTVLLAGGGVALAAIGGSLLAWRRRAR